MDCKFCNAQISEDHRFCPYCGKPLAESEEIVENIQETDGEMDFDQLLEQPAEKKSGLKLWLGIVGGVVALGLLAVLLLTAFGVKFTPRANDIYKKDAYTVAADDAAKKADDVVAKIGGVELTNAQLQIIYRMQIEEFLDYYSSYLSYIGLDYTKALSEQTCYFDNAMTWEQYFLNNALNVWYEYQAMALEAESVGFTLDEEWQAEFEKLPEELEKQSVESGYASAQAFIDEMFGSGCTVDDYLNYIKVLSLSSEYYTTKYEGFVPTDDDVKEHFTANQSYFEQNGVTADTGLISNVRHILICPEGIEDDAGNVTYSDEDWENCLAKAQDVLKEWEEGEATEESFAALASTYSEDGGSQTTGGLYEGVAPGSNYVEEFLSWSTDMARQEGDTGIIKTEYGYHIMYFVSGEEYWMYTARNNLLSERTTALLENAKANWPMEISYKKIVLSEMKIA